MRNSLLIILFLLNLSNSLAASFVIQLDQEKLKTKLGILDSIGISYEKLAPFSDSEYFKGTYQITASEEQIELIQRKVKPLVIEKDAKVEQHAIQPGNNITSDFLSGYQYYHKLNGQKVFRDVSDIESIEILASEKSSIRSLEISKSIKADKEILVAVVDTGIDRSHPELKDAIYRNKEECDEDGNVIPRPSEDMDKNGLVGDCQGWDFAAPKKFAHIVSDKIGHGTHISGIIAAKNNKSGIFGIAPNVKILPIQVFHPDNKSPFTFISTVTKAVLYAVKMNAKIINLSLGWPYTLTPNTFKQALSFAQSKGIIVVSSAGNDGNSQFVAPCALRDVLCVGASGIDGKLASFSNRGLHVDLVAPGEDILSTYPLQSTPSQFSVNGYDVLSGTSQATPMIVGAMALLMEKIPGISPDELYARLSLSSYKTSPLSYSASGIIKLDHALKLEAEPLIRPIVKDFQEILLFDGKKFNFKLLFKNHWKTTENVEISIYPNNSSVKFKKNIFRFDSFNQGSIKEISIIGDTITPDVYNELNLTIDIKAKGMKPFNRKHRIELLSILDNRIILENSSLLDLKPDEALFFQGPELLTKMRSIPHFLDNSIEKSYWLPKKDGVKFISFDSDSKKYIVKSIKPDNFGRILSLEQRDFNYDGNDDFLLRYVSKEKPEFIGYHYFSKSGEKIQAFKYYPEVSVYSVGAGNYIKHITDKGPIALPVWISNGKLPEDDLNPNPWIRNEESKLVKNRIYFLEPENDTLKVRVIDNTDLMVKLEEYFHLDRFHQIEFRQVRSQSITDYYDSKLSYLIGFSRFGPDWTSYELEIDSQGQVEIIDSSIKEYQFFGRLASMFTFNGESFDKTNHLVSNQTDQIMIATNISNAKNGILRSENFKQKLISNVAHFSGNDMSLHVVESERSLIFYDKQGDEYVQRDKISLNRVSFFGNSTFRSSFLPLVYNDGKASYPAIYQDSTFLGNRKISLVLYKPETKKAIASLNKSFKIPSFCTSLNPIQNGSDVILHMLCDINGQLRILKKSF